MTTGKTELDDLTQKLAALGEDAEELSYWRDIFDDLTEQEQEKLMSGLREELSALQSLDAVPPQSGKTT